LAISNGSQHALGADVASALYGVSGAGLKIGIISDSFNVLGGESQDVANGDLPNNVTVLTEGPAGASDEGRAMTQLAYQIAPDATYYFAAGGGSVQSCADAVTALQQAGCNVIIDDLGFGTQEGLYQTGTPLDQAISAAVASGVSYFSAGGNDGDAYYEQGFTPLATTIAGVGTVTANDFGSGSPYLDVTIPPGRVASLLFGWAQPYASIGGSAGAQNSLAMYLLDANGTVVAATTGDQVGSDPTVGLAYLNRTSGSNFRLVVVQNGGTVPAGELFKMISVSGSSLTFNSANANTGSGNMYGHELMADQNSVGAVNYLQTPAYGVSPSVPTTFTSLGPGELLYDSQGNPYPAPVTTSEPNFLAAQGSDTSVPGFAPFDGTSAAAPNAGAVGALVMQADMNLTPAQLTSVLTQSTIPATGTTAKTGAGLIQARAAVEIAAADAGIRFVANEGGDWSDATNWSGGAVPTNADAVSIDDNLGAITAPYLVTVTTTDSAGSVAVASPAGSSATLAIAAGGTLAVGGPNTSDITANDLLVAGTGTLALDGGALAVAGTLNVNNGTVQLSSGTATANTFTQNSGTTAIGGGGTMLTLTGTGFGEIGGTVSVDAGAVLQTTVLAISSASFGIGAGGEVVASSSVGLINVTSFADAGFLSAMGDFSVVGTAANAAVLAGGSLQAASLTIGTSSGAGMLVDEGSIAISGALQTAYTPRVPGTIDLGSGGTLSIGATASNVDIDFTAGGGTLAFTSTDASILSDGLDSVISNFHTAGSYVDLTGLAYDSADTYTYSVGTLTILNGAQNLATLALNPSDIYGDFALSADMNGGVLIQAAPCFSEGTRLLREDGPAAVEALRVGDRLRTASGGVRTIRWIGHRAVDCRRHPRPEAVWPVRIRAGAFGPGLPHTDLVLSPDHAVFAEGVLIPAHRLVNGRTVVQERRDAVTYWHVELERHDVVLAEGLPCESYLDTGNRGAFANGPGAIQLHPDFSALAWEADACAPLVVTGEAVERVRALLDANLPAAARAAVA
jgi:hypothetical protein